MATYAMETIQSGDILVDGIVQTAIKNKFDYDWVVKKLMILSDAYHQLLMGRWIRWCEEAVVYELDKHGLVN